MREKSNLNCGDSEVCVLDYSGFQERIKLEERIRKWMETGTTRKASSLGRRELMLIISSHIPTLLRLERCRPTTFSLIQNSYPAQFQTGIKPNKTWVFLKLWVSSQFLNLFKEKETQHPEDFKIQAHTSACHDLFFNLHANYTVSFSASRYPPMW